MNFTAFIRPGSDIDRRWRGELRRSGIVNGTIFIKGPFNYVASEIEPHNLQALLANPAVQMAAQTAPADALETPAPPPVGEAKTPDVLTVAPQFRPKPRPHPGKGGRK